MGTYRSQNDPPHSRDITELERAKWLRLTQAEDHGQAGFPSLPEGHDVDLACQLMDLRAHFASIPRAAFSWAREASNMYSGISNPFLNRSALKLMEIDDLVQGKLSEGRERGINQASGLSFADLCGGPGGFAQYLLCRGKLKGYGVRGQGWGISLRPSSDCEWDEEALRPFLPALLQPPVKRQRAEKPSGSVVTQQSVQRYLQHPAAQRYSECTSRLQICWGIDGSGNLCKLPNLHHFAAQVQRENNSKVDVVVADGGFRQARSRFDQEEVAFQLLAAEVLSMWLILREGGHFVCKLYDSLLLKTGLVLGFLAQAFEEITLYKPITSRPASSERYVICLCRRSLPPGAEASIVQWLELEVQGEWGKQDEGNVVDCLANNKTFRGWLTDVNTELLRNQTHACWSIIEAAQRFRQDQEQGVIDLMTERRPPHAEAIRLIEEAWELPAYRGMIEGDRGTHDCD